MVRLNQSDFNKLARIYFFANTPNYLLNHFRKNYSVEMISKKYSTTDLIDWIEGINKKTEEDFEKHILGYAMIVALTFKNDDSSIEFIKQCKSQYLKWLEDICTIWKQKQSPSKLFKIDYSPQQKVEIIKINEKIN